jgi:hypothetical protein
MSVTSADGRESVSAQCLKGEAHSFSPTRPELLLAALTRWYVETLSDARTTLEGFQHPHTADTMWPVLATCLELRLKTLPVLPHKGMRMRDSKYSCTLSLWEMVTVPISNRWIMTSQHWPVSCGSVLGVGQVVEIMKKRVETWCRRGQGHYKAR